VRCLSPGGFHAMTYREFGPPGASRVVICVHGLTRNGRDFDTLAAALAEAGFRVVCPDIVGRGESSWLSDPAGYAFPQYLADMTVLLARLEADVVDWVGTSMGGLIGITMAAQSSTAQSSTAQSGTPVRRLVLNDVGPFLPKAALARIGAYVGHDPRFANLEAAEAYVRDVHAGFGALADHEWRHLTEISVAAAEGEGEGEGGGGGEGGGALRLRYDPGIGAAFHAAPPEDVDLWAVWDRLTVPTLVLRGADSDLLLPETAAEMTRRGPRAELTEIAGCGHAPALMDPAQVARVRDWLLG
jgi:pimeloyl-ACP methyl ester carboxylesterase